MALSADIARLNPDGSLTVTHISGDGYLCGAGVILFKNFTTPESQAILWPRPEGACVEDWSEIPAEIEFQDPEEYGGKWTAGIDEVYYLWRDGQWFFRDWEAIGEPLLVLTREVILKDADDYFGMEGVASIADFLDGKARHDGRNE